MWARDARDEGGNVQVEPRCEDDRRQQPHHEELGAERVIAQHVVVVRELGKGSAAWSTGFWSGLGILVGDFVGVVELWYLIEFTPNQRRLGRVGVLRLDWPLLQLAAAAAHLVALGGSGAALGGKHQTLRASPSAPLESGERTTVLLTTTANKPRQRSQHLVGMSSKVLSATAL